MANRWPPDLRAAPEPAAPGTCVIFLRNLWRAPARSIGTVLGMATGIALFVAVQSITLDLRRQLDDAVGAYQLEMVVYERRASSPLSSRLSAAQVEGLRQHFGAAVSPLVVLSMNERWNAYAMVIGAEPSFLARLPLVDGRHAGGASDVLIGELAARRLGLRVGDRLDLAGLDLRVGGVFRSGSRLFDGAVGLPLPLAHAVTAREGEAASYTLAVLRSPDARSRLQWQEDVARKWPALKAISGTEFGGSLRLLRVVDAFVTTISIVVMLATALVLMNTLLTSVRERVREVGILMAIGWAPWRVVGLLGAEAAALGALGAAAGVAMAIGLLQAVNRIESIGFGWIPVRPDGGLIGLAFVATGAAVLVSLLVPTWVVTRVQPLAALRHE